MIQNTVEKMTASGVRRNRYTIKKIKGLVGRVGGGIWDELEKRKWGIWSKHIVYLHEILKQ